MGTPTWRVVLLGGLMGLLAVAVVVGLVAYGSLPGGKAESPTSEGPVLVLLVLPNAQGVNVPRVIDLYTALGASTNLRSVEPTMPATLSGTTSSTLADVYSFGGGAAVAKFYASQFGGPEPAWVVVGPAAWERISAGALVKLDVPADIHVFDGTALYSFSQGTTDVPAPVLRRVFDGATFLDEAQAQMVRDQVGEWLASALGHAGTDAQAQLRSDLSADELKTWLAGLGNVHRVGGP